MGTGVTDRTTMPRFESPLVGDQLDAAGVQSETRRGATDGSRRPSPRAAAYSLDETFRPVTFATCYVYSPRACGVLAAGSRVLRARLKSADPDWLARYAARVWQLTTGFGRYEEFFGPDVVLVPVPRSRPLSAGTPWIAERLATGLVARGLAGSVWLGLQRLVAVQKSATSHSGERPTVATHYRSLAGGQVFESQLGVHPAHTRAPERLLLVDDVVTKGRTMLAAAARLRELCPASEVRAFALVRTMGLVGYIDHLVMPCEGEIRWTGNDASRQP